MSLPKIPDITPNINLKRADVINLLLASVALEEIGLSHILNAEGEKLQKGIANSKSVADLMAVNESVESTLRSLIKQEMLLQFKLENILEIPKGKG